MLNNTLLENEQYTTAQKEHYPLIHLSRDILRNKSGLGISQKSQGRGPNRTRVDNAPEINTYNTKAK